MQKVHQKIMDAMTDGKWVSFPIRLEAQDISAKDFNATLFLGMSGKQFNGEIKLYSEERFARFAIHDEEPTGEDKLFDCPVCDVKGLTKAELVAHINTEHG